jgi:hypothetical protein
MAQPPAPRKRGYLEKSEANDLALGDPGWSSRIPLRHQGAVSQQPHATASPFDSIADESHCPQGSLEQVFEQRHEPPAEG